MCHRTCVVFTAHLCWVFDSYTYRNACGEGVSIYLSPHTPHAVYTYTYENVYMHVYVGVGVCAWCFCVRGCVCLCVYVCAICLGTLAVRAAAAHRNTLQHTATYCNTYCNTLQKLNETWHLLRCAATHFAKYCNTRCEVLQHSCCNTLAATHVVATHLLQHTCCNTLAATRLLQHTLLQQGQVQYALKTTLLLLTSINAATHFANCCNTRCCNRDKCGLH